jgi:quercetin dioxygenase-like cupin family protein
MKTSGWFVLVVGMCCLAAGFGLGAAVGQQTPPMDSKGVDAKVENAFDLGPDFKGFQLRLRTISFEPGAVAGFHSHKDRPAFAYVLQGTLTELRPGGYVKEVGPGGFITESRDVEHWAENRSGAAAKIIGVDIVKP